MERVAPMPASPARGRAHRRRLRVAFLAVALLPTAALLVASVVERTVAGADRSLEPSYGALAVAAVFALGAALAALKLSRRLAAGLEEREARCREALEVAARFRGAFEAATVASELAQDAWLSRLVEEERRVSERHALFRAENAELDGFAYAVSHDLRAPLRHLEAFVALLRKRTAGTLDGPSSHYLDAVAGAAARMATLIDGLLSFLRTRHAELDRSPVDVGGLVRELIEGLAPELAGREIEWKVGELPPVDADAQLLRRALADVLSNALKFTRPRPHAIIEIGGSLSPAEVVLFVRDNGVGFDARYAGKLFGVFQRLHRAEDFEGTGMGLATVRRIVERHGGSVRAESAPGEGATIFMSFPREAGAAAPDPPEVGLDGPRAGSTRRARIS